jgi:hypothetical protein
MNSLNSPGAMPWLAGPTTSAGVIVLVTVPSVAGHTGAYAGAARLPGVLAYDSRLDGSRPAAAHFERDVVGAERELVRRGVRRVLVGGDSLAGTAAMTAAALIPRSVLAGVVVLSSVRKFGVMDAAAAARLVTAPSFFGVGSRDDPFVDEVRKLYAESASKRKQLVVPPSSGTGTQLLDPSWAPPMLRTKLLAFVAAAFRPG